MVEHNLTVSQSIDNVHISVYDAATAPTLEDAQDAEPIAETSEHNTTRPAYHTAIIDGLEGTSIDLQVDSLALGDDNSTSIADGNTLGNELFRTAITDKIRDGQSVKFVIFLDSTEGNGNSYYEAALVAEQSDGSDLPINRTVFDDPEGRLDPKTNEVTAIIEVTITQQDGG